MNYYYAIYCRGFDFYNTNGKKDKLNLRISSIVLISTLQGLNFLAVAGVIGLIHKHTYGNKWIGLTGAFFLIVMNCWLIGSDKSDTLREEYCAYSREEKRKINLIFYGYIILSILLFVGVVAIVAYYKHRFGNYDDPHL